ncbi:glycosyltransferase family 4 protein [Paenibacillus lentus]|uniref:Glycosyltransferase n=1 Tax=Paenibacillus lentus TaxID=1338368 RepID=A0A3Q8SDR1_9BACL|nr:glycosyltransferase family 4 protein [Paenibacillus lentus]AZK48349.1 glycosyltransferase [Paenibacillus lentus]
MKILFTFYVPSGGVETLNRLRCEALKEIGIEGHLLYLEGGSGLQNISGIPVYISPTDDELHNLLKLHMYDAIIATSDYLMTQRLRQVGYTGPIVYELQGLGTREQAEQALKEAEPILRECCQAALMPPTSHLVELVTELCPSIPRYIFPNPLDTVTFSPRAVEASARPIIAWIGRLDKNKNWELFLHIAHSLVLAKPELLFWIFLDDKLSSEAGNNSFWEIVRLRGLNEHLQVFSNAPHSSMPNYLSSVGESGGFLLSTSYLEGFGYAVAEAISCRCPVLSSDSDGVRFFIRHNETGKFFDMGDVSGAVKEALELMNDHRLREKIRSNGHEFISGLMTPRQYAESFRQMLLTL